MKKKMICLLALTLVLALLFAAIPAQAAPLGVQDNVLGLTGENGAFTPLIRNDMLTNTGLDFFRDMPDEPLGELGSYMICGTAVQQAAAAALGLTTDEVLSWAQLGMQLDNLLSTLKTVDAEKVDLPQGYATLAAFTAALEALQEKMAFFADAEGGSCLSLNELQALCRLRLTVTGMGAVTDFSTGTGDGPAGRAVPVETPTPTGTPIPA